MTTSLREVVQEIERLHQEATPGPWRSDNEIRGWWGGELPGVRVAYDTITERGVVSSPVCMVEKDHSLGGATTAGSLHPLEDAALIAALRNAWPLLREALGPILANSEKPVSSPPNLKDLDHG